MLVDNKTWNAPSPEDKRIQALAAKLAKMEKKADAASKQPTDKTKTKPKGSDNKQEKDKPKWLQDHRPPAKGKLSDPRVWNMKNSRNLTFYWCCKDTGGHCDGKWRAHKPSKCKPASEFKRHYKNRIKTKRNDNNNDTKD